MLLTRRHDKTDFRAIALNDRIRADSVGEADDFGFVQESRNVATERLGARLDAVYEAPGQVMRRCGNLDGAHLSAMSDEAVRKRATRVDVDCETHNPLSIPYSPCPVIPGYFRRSRRRAG